MYPKNPFAGCGARMMLAGVPAAPPAGPWSRRRMLLGVLSGRCALAGLARTDPGADPGGSDPTGDPSSPRVLAAGLAAIAARPASASAATQSSGSVQGAVPTMTGAPGSSTHVRWSATCACTGVAYSTCNQFPLPASVRTTSPCRRNSRATPASIPAGKPNTVTQRLVAAGPDRGVDECRGVGVRASAPAEPGGPVSIRLRDGGMRPGVVPPDGGPPGVRGPGETRLPAERGAPGRRRSLKATAAAGAPAERKRPPPVGGRAGEGSPGDADARPGVADRR